MKQESKPSGSINCLNHHTVERHNDVPEEHQIMATVVDHSVMTEPASDNGAVVHVIRPDDTPKDVHIELNTSNDHYSDASGGIVIRHGSATTKLTDADGREMRCATQVADVVRPLHSVSQTTGTADGSALAGMVYTNKLGCVVPLVMLNVR